MMRYVKLKGKGLVKMPEEEVELIIKGLTKKAKTKKTKKEKTE